MSINKVENKKTLTAIDTLNAAGSVWYKNPAARAAMTLACRDTDYLPKVKNAGETKFVDDVEVQIMHNGLLVRKNGYQGEWQSKIIEGLNGNHEPQEEKVFHEVVQRLKGPCTMMELGSWWSYYSLWFLKAVPGSLAVCCEPDPANRELGTTNARLNGFKEGKDIVFYPSASGSTDGKIIDFVCEDGSVAQTPIRTVDGIMSDRKFDKLDILHMDIQGFEMEALQGAIDAIKSKKIRFLFVSTHHYAISGNPLLHYECLKFIKENGGHIISKHTILESSSGDGLIVASFDNRDKDFSVDISLQPTDDSLFRPAEEDTAILWNAHNEMIKDVSQAHRLVALVDSLKEQQKELAKEYSILQSQHQMLLNRTAKQRATDLAHQVLKSTKDRVYRYTFEDDGKKWRYAGDEKITGDLDQLSVQELLSSSEKMDSQSAKKIAKRKTRLSKKVSYMGMRYSYKVGRRVIRPVAKVTVRTIKKRRGEN